MKGSREDIQSINRKVTYDSGKGRKVWGMNKSSLIWIREGLGRMKGGGYRNRLGLDHGGPIIM